MAYIGNTPGVSSQRYVQRETVTGSPKSAFIVTTGYSLGYVDVFVNGSQLDEADFTATDGVTVTLGVAAAVGDLVRIIAWLPRGLSDGYLKSEADARYLQLTGGTLNSAMTLTSANAYYPQVVQRNTTADGNASYLALEKTRNGAIVQNGDILGNIVFRGFDGTQQLQGAAIWSRVSAAPGTNDMPGSLVFGTTGDGGSGVTERMALDHNGNLGLGVAPNASWSSIFRVMQIGANGTYIAGRNDSQQINLGTNSYYNGAAFIYANNGYATRFSSDSGAFTWQIAPSGTAGDAISLTQAMTLTAAGQLLVGTTTAAQKLTIGAGSIQLDNAQYLFGKTSSGTSTRLLGINSANDVYIGSIDSAAGSLIFNFGGISRAVLDASGRLGLGGAPNSRFDLGTYGSATQISWHTDTATSYGHIAIQNSSAALGIMSGLRMGAAANSFESSISGNWGKAVVLLDYGRIRFFTNPADTVAYGSSYTPSERVRIESDGSFLVGTTSTFAACRATIKGAGNTLTVWEQNGSSAAALICRVDNVGGRLTTYNYLGADVGTVTTNGTTTSYNTSSDYRLKENIQPMTGALARVALLKPVTYTWKADGSAGEGFIAHELAEVCPQAVTGEKDAVDAQGNPQYQGIDVSFLVGTLTAAIQELNTKLEAQAAEIAVLKGNA